MPEVFDSLHVCQTLQFLLVGVQNLPILFCTQGVANFPQARKTKPSPPHPIHPREAHRANQHRSVRTVRRVVPRVKGSSVEQHGRLRLSGGLFNWPERERKITLCFMLEWLDLFDWFCILTTNFHRKQWRLTFEGSVCFGWVQTRPEICGPIEQAVCDCAFQETEIYLWKRGVSSPRRGHVL